MFDPYTKWLGIPVAEQPPNHYRLLGLNLLENDPDVISNAADRQMAYIRGFQAGPYSAESQKILNELSTARICLLSPPKKASYDAQLQAQRKARQQAAGPPSDWQFYVLGAARYVRCQFRRLGISGSELPAAYRRLGREVFREGRYQDRLIAWHDELRETAQRIAAVDPQAAPPSAPCPTPPPATDLLPASAPAPEPPALPPPAEPPLGLLRRTRQKVQIFFWRRKYEFALEHLGAAAYDVDGVVCGPSEFTAPIQECRLTLERLRAEAAHLNQPLAGQWLSPARLAWIVLGTIAGLALFFLWLRWIVS
jgi:hypothetical protein